MKKNKIAFLLTLPLITLVSCNGTLTSSSSPSNSSDSTSETSDSSSNSNTSIGEADGYYLSNVEGTLQENNISTYNWHTSDSVGEQKLLIVPVQLSGATSWTSSMLDEVETAFFSDGTDTTFESVSSYFNESSYGKLTITGEITDVFTSSYTVNQLSRHAESSSDYLIAEYLQTADLEQYQDYDVNGDGYIDNVIFLYSNNYDGNAFWAWCSSYQGSSSSSLKLNNYMWASYEFLNDRYSDNYNFGLVDAHTYIHETGHLLGLDDYYDYNYSYAWDCGGGLEMQAYNIGDHNIYSKMALGWVDPYVVTDSCSINLKTSASSGEAIILKDGFSDSIYDEYIIIEYYTPTGLNQVDSEHIYSNGNRMYQDSGLRIYHVDSRLVKVRQYSYEFVSYVDDFGTDSANEITTIGASNTVGYSMLDAPYNYSYKYLHLIDRGGYNTLSRGMVAQGRVLPTNALFREGDTLVFSENAAEGEISLKDYFANKDNEGNALFNDGTSLNYRIEVGSMDDDSINVTFTKLA